MSANRLKHSESGFTLIEVTLAIVIGVVVIAGATVLYNQAKNSAASTAAQNKVNAAAATIEEFAAKNFGRYPTDAQFVASWTRTRPDDVANSPWGGLTGEADGILSGTVLNANVAEVAAETTGNVGTIEYRVAATNATYSVYDRQIQSNKTVRGYGVWIYDDKGRGPNFVAGGK